MAAFLVIGTLAAFGAWAMIWTLFGFLLPQQRGTMLVHLCRGRQGAVVRHWNRLRELGLLHCPLILLECPQQEQERLAQKDVEFWSLEDWFSRLEQEREGIG